MSSKSGLRVNMTEYNSGELDGVCDVCGLMMVPVQAYSFLQTTPPIYIWECKTCTEREIAEETKRELEKKAREKYDRDHRGIPPIYHSCKISDFSNIEPVIEWAKKPSGFLFIHGTTGTGKTHLVCSIKKRYNELRFDSELFFSSDVFLEIRNSFNSKVGHSEEEIIKKCTRSTIAFFDDFGTQKNSEYSIETWYNIINARYMNNLPTVFTSNLKVKEVSEIISDRIASRIASGLVFELKGTDRRLTNRSQRRKPIRDLSDVF